MSSFKTTKERRTSTFMDKWQIDLGCKYNDITPFYKRSSISLLLGAGFSAPMGYPVGNDLNKLLLNFDDKIIDFSPSGELTISTNGQKPLFQIEGIRNFHQRCFEFCKQLIKEYYVAHDNMFDYEQFYDFITIKDEAIQERYQTLCIDLLGEHEDYLNMLYSVDHIYNQMVAYLLKDRNGKNRYDDEPFKVNYVEGYNGFLSYLSKMSSTHIIDVHTLNHDMLFESFNHTGYINGNISDGFDEFGSDYYGKLLHDNRTYHCRLERYTGRYNTPIHLYKLHGSLDYVRFYRRDKNGFMTPEKYVKTRWGMGTGDIMKGRKSKIGYDLSPFEYHADFLTGTTSKIQRYNEPLLFRKLFKKFKNNLHKADMLIIIGYGCKDAGINEMIEEHFDFHNKPVFIVDKYAGEGVEKFKNIVHAQLHRIDIDKIDPSLF